jgi:hypothetical protein
MAGYKEIKGFQVQTRSEDPTPYAQALEDNPYVGAWSSGGAMNTARYGATVGTSGIQTAAIAAGGNPNKTETEQYNGSSWTETGDLNTGRSRLGGAATSYTASVAFGGYITGPGANSALTEKFDGSSWTETGDLSTARRMVTGAGTQTAGLAFGGQSPGSPAVDSTEEFGGTSWTSGGALNTANNSSAGAGTQTAAFKVHTTTHEQYNGSSWTETTEINNSRSVFAGAGTTTASLVFGGENPSTQLANTESWDGSAWTEVADLASAQYFNSGAGTNTLALSFAVDNPTPTATEEWAFSGLPPSTPAAGYANAIVGDFYYNSSTGQFKNINAGGAPIGTWASGGVLNTARQENFGNGAGTQTAAAVSGGYTTTNSTNHEQYDGTSWTETTEINTGRYGTWADGTQPAFWMAGGYSTTYVDNTETWNGSSWTEVNEINTARAYGGGTTGRSLTAGLVVAGYNGSNVDNVEQWDGTNWTEVSEVNTARRKAGGFGTSTAAFAMGAAPSPSAPATNLVESWDGTSWTETTEFNTGRGAVGAAGTTTDGLIYGSEQTPRQITESWNGTTWTEVADMGANQGNSAGAGGTATSAWIAGGTNGSTGVTNTEEFTAADFQIKTVTTS